MILTQKHGSRLQLESIKHTQLMQPSVPVLNLGLLFQKSSQQNYSHLLGKLRKNRWQPHHPNRSFQKSLTLRVCQQTTSENCGSGCSALRRNSMQYPQTQRRCPLQNYPPYLPLLLPTDFRDYSSKKSLKTLPHHPQLRKPLAKNRQNGRSGRNAFRSNPELGQQK